MKVFTFKNGILIKTEEIADKPQVETSEQKRLAVLEAKVAALETAGHV